MRAVVAWRALPRSFALSRQNRSTGRGWRVAWRVDARVLEQVSEADVDTSVVLVFRVTGMGTAVRFALTVATCPGRRFARRPIT